MQRIEPITNGPVTDTADFLAKCIRDSSARKVSIASAFVTVGGLRLLLPALEKATLDRKIEVKLLTGLKDSFTEPAALDSLQKLQLRSNGLFNVRVSKNRRFHAKCYVIELNKKVLCLIGSANMTSDGLCADGELCVEIDSSLDAPFVRKTLGWFRKEFTNAWLLDKDLVRRYARVRKPIERVISKQHGSLGILWNDLRKRRRRISDTENGIPPRVPVVWHTSIDGELSAHAAKQLKNQADWYGRSEPTCICYSTRPSSFDRVREGDVAVVCDFSGGRRKGQLKIASIIGKHEFPPTDDGRYFLVLRYRNRRRKRLSTIYARSLMERGFVKSRDSLGATLRQIGSERLRVLEDDLGKIRR